MNKQLLLSSSILGLSFRLPQEGHRLSEAAFFKVLFSRLGSLRESPAGVRG